MGLDMYAYAYKTLPKSAAPDLFEALLLAQREKDAETRAWIEKNYPDLTKEQVDAEMAADTGYYVSGWDHAPDPVFPAVADLFGRKPDDGSPSFTVHVNGDEETLKVACTIAYWRKVNSVHQWFVENVQDGVDECEENFFEREKLEELKAAVDEAIAAQDGSKLPTQGGFFFGSTEYDDWYWQDLKDTSEMLDSILKDEVLTNAEFSYCSSW